jgi:hypothetical protein
MQQLRDCGIYTLPEGGEFVAHAVFRGGYVFYTPVAWEFFGMHAYESDGTGNIHSHGRSTGWHIKDLTGAGGRRALVPGAVLPSRLL